MSTTCANNKPEFDAVFEKVVESALAHCVWVPALTAPDFPTKGFNAEQMFQPTACLCQEEVQGENYC